MRSGDRVALSLSVYEAVDRQDPETLLQPQQTEEEEEEEEEGRKDWQCCELDKFIPVFLWFS